MKYSHLLCFFLVGGALVVNSGLNADEKDRKESARDNPQKIPPEQFKKEKEQPKKEQSFKHENERKPDFDKRDFERRSDFEKKNEIDRTKPEQYKKPINEDKYKQTKEVKIEDRVKSREKVKEYVNKSKKVNKEQSPEIKKQKAEEFKKTWSERKQQNERISKEYKEKFKRNHPEYHHWFNDDFYSRHHQYPYWRHHHDWWRGARWNTIVVWLPWGWGSPVYYTEGGSPVYLTQDYDSGAPAMSQESSQDEWLPLGVFAAGRNASEVANSTLFVQLAVSKHGEIAGTTYNSASDEAFSIDGIVDRQSQEAVWKQSDDPNAPMMSAGMYNLTQDVVPVLLSYPSGSQENWVFIRITQ